MIEALNLKGGNSVVDIGSGSGYFSLKLSDPVGGGGRVIAEDIRQLPLTFLWVRAVRKGKHNITVRLGTADNPRLPPNSADPALISNTYHEFSDPLSILAQVRQALLSGGRLVVIDRAPDPTVGKTSTQEHEVSSEQVETDLRHADFAIDARTEHLIEKDPENETWWMIVAHHP